MDCHDVRELLSAYTDNELSDEACTFVQSHLANCDACQILVQEWNTLSRLTRDTFHTLIAPASFGAGVLHQITLARHAKQDSQLSWLAMSSAITMTVLALSGGFALLWSLNWGLVRLVLQLASGIDRLLIQLVFRQGWLVGSILIAGTITASICMVGMQRLIPSRNG